MNNSTVAKNGFKTFILTLAVSLIIFSVIYYLKTESVEGVSIEGTDTVSQVVEDTPPENTVATAETNAFRDLRNRAPVAERSVLGGATTTETTQSTVPGTGITGITYAFIISMGLTLLGAYLFIYEPRRRALLDFENRVKRGLR